MTDRHIPGPDLRRHFIITGTYTSEDAVMVRELQQGVEKVLTRWFADPVRILAYGTPRYHHPYAVDVREQFMKLTDEEFTELNDRFPYLMTALLTFFKGAFEGETRPSPTVVDANPNPAPASGV